MGLIAGSLAQSVSASAVRYVAAGPCAAMKDSTFWVNESGLSEVTWPPDGSFGGYISCPPLQYAFSFSSRHSPELRSGDAGSAKEMHDESDHRNDNQQMNQASGDMKCEKAESPGNEKNDGDGEQHEDPLTRDFPRFSTLRAEHDSRRPGRFSSSLAIAARLRRPIRAPAPPRLRRSVCFGTCDPGRSPIRTGKRAGSRNTIGRGGSRAASCSSHASRRPRLPGRS